MVFSVSGYGVSRSFDMSTSKLDVDNSLVLGKGERFWRIATLHHKSSQWLLLFARRDLKAPFEVVFNLVHVLNPTR